MAQDADRQVAARREERLMAEVDKVRQSASMGLAVVTGHLGGDEQNTSWI
jgi:hypothetical protein